jgi:hypothetical protein
MKKVLHVLWFSVLLAGCTRHYYVNETSEPDETTRHARFLHFETILKSAKADDPLTVTLYNGTLITGHFFSYNEGILSIRVGETFRDLELTDVRSMSFKSESKEVKWTIYTLAGLCMGFIVYTFLKNH